MNRELKAIQLILSIVLSVFWGKEIYTHYYNIIVAIALPGLLFLCALVFIFERKEPKWKRGIRYSLFLYWIYNFLKHEL